MVGPNYKRPAVPEPQTYKSNADSVSAALLSPEWWHLYADPDLDRLIATATASNQTLAQAVAAVDQARALARVAASFLAPTVTTNPTFTRERTSGTRKSNITGETVGAAATFNDWLVPIDLTYEIDVWGRVRRGLESARAQAVASADDEAAVPEALLQSTLAQQENFERARANQEHALAVL